MLIAALVVLNIPVYIFIAWLAFDDAEDTAVSFFESVVAVLKAIFIPGIVRVLMEDEDEGAWGLLPVGAFFLACGGIVYGEYYLITRFLLSG